MVGPLVVAVWVGFLMRNLMPYLIYNRMRWVLRKRGERIGCCQRILIALTCCCGTHEEKVEDCFGEKYSTYEGFTEELNESCLLYTSPSPRDKRQARMPSSA